MKFKDREVRKLGFMPVSESHVQGAAVSQEQRCTEFGVLKLKQVSLKRQKKEKHESISDSGLFVSHTHTETVPQ